MTVVYVAGQARCGSSLTMAMLAAAGFPVVGTAPDYEIEDVNHRPVPEAFLARHDRHALKLLDPAQTPVPRHVSAYAIWLTRDPLEQAKSHAKFLSASFGRRMYNRSDIRNLARSLRRDEPGQMAALSHCAMLVVSFEELITAPQDEARKIADFMRPLAKLDPIAMAAVVHQRSPRCAQDLSREIAGLIAAGAI